MRDRSEVQSLCFSVQMRRTPSGFTLGLDAVGPIGVPIALELAFPRVGALENVSPCLDDTPNIHFLLSGQGHYRHLGDTLTFGPGSADHRWHPFLAPTGFHWPPDEPASRQYVYIPLLTPVSAVLTLA
jgi:hypothetical protein